MPKKEVKREQRIRIKVTDEEKEIIAKRAKAAGRPTAAYAREAALCPTLVTYDYSAIEEHTKKIKKVGENIDRVIFTVEALGTYVQKDIEYIENSVRYIYDSEKELIEFMRKKRKREYEKSRRDAIKNGEWEGRNK